MERGGTSAPPETPRQCPRPCGYAARREPPTPANTPFLAPANPESWCSWLSRSDLVTAGSSLACNPTCFARSCYVNSCADAFLRDPNAAPAARPGLPGRLDDVVEPIPGQVAASAESQRNRMPGATADPRMALQAVGVAHVGSGFGACPGNLGEHRRRQDRSRGQDARWSRRKQGPKRNDHPTSRIPRNAAARCCHQSHSSQ